jgi:hypothetical protein
MNTALLAALLSLLAWLVLAWFLAITAPAVHLLLAAAATLVVYGVGRKE